MGARRFWLSRHSRSIICRYLLRQLLQNDCCGDATEAVVEHLFQRCAGAKSLELTVDLDAQLVRDDVGLDVNSRSRLSGEMLMRGLDEIGRTLLDEAKIAAFEGRRAREVATR